MKQLFFGALGVFLLCALTTGCSNDNNTAARIIVTVEGVDSVDYMYMSLAGQQKAETEKPIIGAAARGKDGNFALRIPDDANTYAVILQPQGLPMISSRHLVKTTLFPGENLSLNVKIEPQTSFLEYTLTGSPALEAEGEHRKERYENLLLEIEALSASIDMLKNEATKINVRKRLNELSDSIQRIKTDYIRNHPNEPLAGYYVATIGNIYAVDSLYDMLTDEVKNSNLKEMIDYTVKSSGEMTELLKNREGLTEGQPVKDFTLKNMKGEDFKLSSLYGQGKYIVLDFWGSWCEWCIKGMPEMKAAYEKYAATGKLEIVGICHGDTEKVWKKTVDKYELPWIQVLSEKGESDLTKSYGIQAFPTKIILTPDGIIAAAFEGESPEFYEKLDELLR